MDIIFEPSEYRFLNAGDSAMTQVAISRLTSICPEARIRVLTSHPELLPSYPGNVSALPDTGRLLWLSENLLSRNRSQNKLFRSWGRTLTAKQPILSRLLRRFKYFHRDPLDQEAVERFLAGMRAADCFLVAGMGGITSAFPEYSRMLLDTLALAQALNVPTLLFGQGIGPFDAELEQRARQVLTKVNYIALREGRHGPKCLRAWGVPSERWTVTGDDAIELAYDNRTRSIGNCIGVNVRISDYSAVSDHLASVLREPLQRTANSLGARLRSVPISRLPDEADASQVNRLFDGYTAVHLPETAVDTPLRVIQEIQHCRLVITGSYHAGVFALAQGIPVIGIVGSEYYQWKFEGLAHQFGDGCRILRLATASTASDLESLIRDLWEKAPALRQALLTTAREQRDAGRMAYNKMLSIVKPGLEGIQCRLR